jgi:hypothetical protein
MASLSGRKWYTAALVLAIGAIAAQLLGQYEAGRGLTTMARGTQALSDARRDADLGMDAVSRTEVAEWQRLRHSAYRHAHRAVLWGGASTALVSLAAICWALSTLRGGRGGRGVVPALLAIYLLLLLLVV